MGFSAVRVMVSNKWRNKSLLTVTALAFIDRQLSIKLSRQLELFKWESMVKRISQIYDSIPSADPCLFDPVLCDPGRDSPNRMERIQTGTPHPISNLGDKNVIRKHDRRILYTKIYLIIYVITLLTALTAFLARACLFLPAWHLLLDLACLTFSILTDIFLLLYVSLSCDLPLILRPYLLKSFLCHKENLRRRKTDDASRD